MSGVVDIGFWIYFLIVALPMFALGYLTRSWVEAERRRRRWANSHERRYLTVAQAIHRVEIERAKRRHPAHMTRWD